MYIDDRQFEYIKSPKRGCQRGLEPYIVRQHLGDKTVVNQSGKPGYMFMNNPIYRIGKEGDPAPGSISSRTINNPNLKLNLNQSTLHLLYPRIDSGSVLLDQENWDQRWWYNRENVTPAFSITGKSLVKDEIASENYDDFADNVQERWDQHERRVRFIPIYDQARINDEIVPDGIRDINLRQEHLNDVASTCKCDYCRSGLAHPKWPFPDYVNTTEVPTGKVVELEKRVATNVEGFNYTKPQDYGHYGYPQPSGYAGMEGKLGTGYNVNEQKNDPIVPNFIRIPDGYKSGIHYVKPQTNPMYDVLDEGLTKNDDSDQKHYSREDFVKTPGRTLAEDGNLSSEYRKAVTIVLIVAALILISYIIYLQMKKGV